MMEVIIAAWAVGMLMGIVVGVIMAVVIGEAR
jgi:hypothetical protein